MKDRNEAVWGQIEKIGKGTKANYDPAKKTITICLNKSPETSSELLRKTREQLTHELKELGYVNRVNYNGEIVVDNIEKQDIVLEKKNHKLIIRINKRLDQEKEQQNALKAT